MKIETWFNNLFLEHFGSAVVVTIVAIIALAFLVWKVAEIWFRIKNLPCENHTESIKDLQKRSLDKGELPCQIHNDKIEQHGKSVSRIDTTLSFLTKSIEDMNLQLRKINDNSSFTQQHSPLTISPRGWDVVKKLGIDRMFDENWPRIKQLIDAEVECKNAYDINEFCLKYAVVFPEKFLQQEQVNKLKDDAYAQGLSLMEYMKIVAVMARDRYFKENGIKVEDKEEKK